MRKFLKFLVIGVITLFSMSAITSCSTVPAGNVGIKFYLLGSSKGVDHEQLNPGRYWIGINEELYLFPTFTQNYVWTHSEDEGSPNDESFNFQDKDGLELNADVGITYHLEPSKVPLIFQKYKKGIDEITDVFLRNIVRDALVSRSSRLQVEYIYGEGKEGLMDSVQSDVKREVESLGIIVDKLYWIGRVKLPETVKASIDAKIKATQDAQKTENELRMTEAAAKKVIAAAEGQAKAKIIAADAEAYYNRTVSASLTPLILEKKRLEKWNGVYPQYYGINGGLIVK